jgi:hypothetical protein
MRMPALYYELSAVSEITDIWLAPGVVVVPSRCITARSSQRREQCLAALAWSVCGSGSVTATPRTCCRCRASHSYQQLRWQRPATTRQAQPLLRLPLLLRHQQPTHLHLHARRVLLHVDVPASRPCKMNVLL